MQHIASLQVESIAVGDLHLHPHNARQGDVGAIAQSLEAHGQYRPIVVQRSSMNVIAGNHTLRAVSALGWERIDATLIDVDDDQALRILLVDNRANDLATYDNAVLTDLLESLVRSDYGLEGTGFTGDDLDELMLEFHPEPQAEIKEDELPAPPIDPVTKPGDVWVLGRHRLVCGDSTDPVTYEALLKGERADCIWTDPPYGVEYVGKTKDALTIKNDGANGLPALLRDAFGCWEDASIEGASVYIAHPPGALSLDFYQAFVNAGWRWHQTLCWDKETIVLGHSDYHYSHEPILFGYLPGGGRRGRGGSGWYGDNSQRSVLRFPKPTVNKEHPTMKPIALIAACINNSAPHNGLVLDPFGGSGSTLMACEQTNRVGRTIELDPRYCDVICARFERHTGIAPVLESMGEARSFLTD